MIRRIMSVIVLSLAAGAGYAGDDDIDDKIKAAREKLDAAAQELAELHKTQFGQGHDKAMLGILLGEGPPVEGIELVGVTPGGGAEAAGLKTGDIIVRIGDAALDKADNPMQALVNYMKNIKPGARVAVRYRRGDRAVDTQITTEAHSRHMLKIIHDKEPRVAIELEKLIEQGGPGVRVHRQPPLSDQLMGVEGGLAEYFGVKRGVVVKSVPATSELRSGDVLLKINEQDVEDVAAASAALVDLESAAVVTVKRKGKTRRVTAQPGEFVFADDKPGKQIRVRRVDDNGETIEDVVIDTND